MKKIVIIDGSPRKKMNTAAKGMITIDTTNMCSHLQRKLFEKDGIYHSLWIAMQDDPELTAVVRSRQLHIYRNGHPSFTVTEIPDAFTQNGIHHRSNLTLSSSVTTRQSSNKFGFALTVPSLHLVCAIWNRSQSFLVQTHV